MKKSKKVFLIFASCPIGLTLLFLCALRLTLGTSTAHERPETPGKVRITRTFDVERFTAIQVTGRWEVKLAQGENPKVEVEAPQAVMGDLVVREDAGSLLLDKGTLRRDRYGKLRASIVTPSLEDLGLKGLIDLRLKGFHSERLSISTDGVATITGKENRIQELHLAGEGMSKINFKKNPVTNADLHYEGMHTIRLSMAGGVLSGTIKGLGKVLYDGQVSEERIRCRGRCKVRHD